MVLSPLLLTVRADVGDGITGLETFLPGRGFDGRPMENEVGSCGLDILAVT